MTRRFLAVVVVAACAVYAPAAAAAPPPVSAPAAFLFQPDTRDVIFARQAQDRRSIASTTKLMTALVALDELELAQTVTVPAYDAAPAESVVGLRAGERIRVADLMRALMLGSGNDAAHALAVVAAGSVPRFVRRMNRRARELGLEQTRFANPIGLDQDENHSSAEDLVKMALLLRRNSFLREVMNQPRAVLRSGSQSRVVLNRNELVARHDFVNGVKTGHTLDAGYVLVGSATRGGVSVVSSVLGAPSEAARDADTLALLRYGLSRYRRQRAVRAREVVARAAIADQDGARAALAAQESVAAVVRRGERLQVRVVGAPAEIAGPAAAGTPVGTVEVLRRGEVVGSTPLVTAAAVPAPAAPERVRSWLSRTGTIVLLAFLVGCTVLLVWLRRRVVRRRIAGRNVAGAREPT